MIYKQSFNTSSFWKVLLFSSKFFVPTFNYQINCSPLIVICFMVRLPISSNTLLAVKGGSVRIKVLIYWIKILIDQIKVLIYWIKLLIYRRQLQIIWTVHVAVNILISSAIRDWRSFQRGTDKSCSLMQRLHFLYYAYWLKNINTEHFVFTKWNFQASISNLPFMQVWCIK